MVDYATPPVSSAGRSAPEDRPKRDRRRQLIEATIDAINQHGLSGTTLARVGELAGLSPGIVGFYFHSKDALLLATLSHIAEEFETCWRSAVTGAHEGAAAKLRAMVDAVFDSRGFDPRRVAVWNAFWGEARARSDYMAVCGHRDAAYHEQIVTLCRDIAREGRYPQLDPGAVGEACVALMDSLPEGVLVDSARFDVDEARRTCLAFLASVFPGEFAPARAPAAPSTEGVEPGVREAASTAQTLPGWVYSSPDFFELEKEHIFRRQWLLVGHVSEAPEPGDYMTLDAVDERIVVVRDLEGRLRAFHNVCRHRASRVVVGARGHCERAIVCPYHGWTYHLNGRLRAVPEEQSFRNLDKSRYSLPEVELDEWMGFVFVRIDQAQGPRVSQLMSQFDEELSPYRLRELRPLGPQWTQTLEVNWKAVHDNDNEGYHVRIGHPGLRRLFGDSYYDEAFDDGISRSRALLRDEISPVWSEGLYQRWVPELADHLPEALRRTWCYYGIFPTVSFGIYPDMVEYFQSLPLAPGRTLLTGRSFALADDRRAMRVVRYLNRRINRQVGREDEKFCYWADGGLKSSSYQGGPLSDREVAVRQFHDRIRELLPVARRSRAPEPGWITEAREALR